MITIEETPILELLAPFMSKLNLSKSLFIKGQQCFKALWFQKYSPELGTQPDENRQTLFREGHAVGDLALQLYPGGRHIKHEAETIPHRLKLTKEAIENGEETLYEATFQFNQTLIMIDILHCGPRGWEVIEVKSSTSEKPIHTQDLALQAYVLEGLNFPAKSFYLLHLNNHYERGEKLSLIELFTRVNLTEKVLALKSSIEPKIEQLRTQLKRDIAPNIEIGPHCFSPFECNFITHCWKDIPKKSVFEIHGLQLDQKLSLFRQGIIQMTEVPTTHPLTARQKQQISTEKSEEKIIDRVGINAFLKHLHYPLYFLDFEAFQMAIPPFKNTKPFQQIAFQFSLHSLETPGSELHHDAFISAKNQDPRYEMAKALTTLIPDNACIVVYNSGFEKSVFKQLGELFPEFKNKLNHCHDQIVDLMTPFQNQLIYTKEMNGSYSIKAILPALIPELNYNHLEIKDGQSASRAYFKRNISTSETDQKTIETQLLDYCQMDTFAMVKIIELLQSICYDSSHHD